MKKFLGRFKYYLIGVLVIGLLFGVYYLFFAKKGNGQETIIIQPADFIQTVAVSGKVIPAKSVELSFSRSGKVTQTLVEEGQRIEAGQLIASLDSRDAELALNSARLDLKKIIESNNPNSVSGSAKNYEDSLANINKTFFDVPDIVDGLEDILINYQSSPYKNNLPNNIARDNLEVAIASFYKNLKVYKTTLAHYQSLQRPLSNDSIVALNEEVYTMLQGLSQMMKDAETYIHYVYDVSEISSRTGEMSTDRSHVGTWLQTINSDLALIGASRDTLKVSTLDVEGQKLTVDQRANEYSQYFLRAPFSGVITQMDIKTGEVVSTGQVKVKMINSGVFQIESFVPEINIANLTVGNLAEVTLDAYGEDVPFSAKIISIDPAETIRDGVSTYKVKLQFEAEDSRIKSGMTANLQIVSGRQANVLAVPAGAIYTQSGQKYVKILAGEQTLERMVTIGKVGALGKTQILSGLKAGDQVVLDPQIK